MLDPPGNSTTTVASGYEAHPWHRDDSNVFLGVLLVLLGTILGTTGKQLIRTSELRKLEHQAWESKMFLWAGLAINIFVIPVCDLSGYAFAPASVIAPFTGLDVVWNALIAPYTLKEELTRRRFASAVVVFLSASFSAVFRQRQEVEYTARYVRVVWTRWRTPLYCFIFAAWCLFNNRVLMRYPRGSLVRSLSLGATAGTLAGNMWCTKMTAELVATCLGGDCEAWLDSVTWLTLLGAIFFAVSNLPFMTSGMQQYETLFMVTLFQGTNIVTNCISASAVLAEMDGAPGWKIGGYVACILSMTAAMALLARGEDSGMERRRVAQSESAALPESRVVPEQVGLELESHFAQTASVLAGGANSREAI